jgi:hypothetical protein
MWSPKALDLGIVHQFKVVLVAFLENLSRAE